LRRCFNRKIGVHTQALKAVRGGLGHSEPVGRRR
jgi:hypothetical protein